MTVDPQAAAIYGSYNARSVDARVVAENFVAPPQFWEAVPQSNSVLSGPRGSGKTTLLKMLEARAIEHWTDDQADRAREAVTYSGVFVPADRSWSGQVQSVASDFPPELRTSLGLASFALHALRALSACGAERISRTEAEHPHDRVSMDAATEERIAQAVCRQWALGEPVGSFQGLRFALSDLLFALGRLARRARRDAEARERLLHHPALDLDPVEAMVPFIDRFNDAVGQESHVWMFLIDEIEFLPPGIRSEILLLMRGRDPRIMQKVSLAPYTSVSDTDDPLGGWVGHDYQRIDLTFADKEDGYPFNSELVETELKRKDLEITPEHLFGGAGAFESDAGADAYQPGSVNAGHISSLAEKDEGFAGWLQGHKVDPKNPSATQGTDRAATVRKAMPIILLRDEFLHRVGDRLERRSRKNPPTYVGAFSAYALCEGNPRLLKALVVRLLRVRADGRLDDATRAEAVEQAAREYELHMRAITLPAGLSLELNPRPLVKRIGGYFEQRVLGKDFDPEPPLSFTVSEADLARPNLREVLRQLVHYGAFVQISEGRFRLAHMFAPLFHLPLRRGREIALRTILGAPPGHEHQLPIQEAPG